MASPAMQKSAFGPVQTAMFTTMTGDSALSTLVGGRIYDDVPQNQVFPYVNFGSWTSIPYLTHERGGEEVTITLHCWSVYRGWSELQGIVEQLNRLFGNSDLVVQGYDVVKSYYEYSALLRQLDDVRHAPVRYRLLVQEA